MLFAVVWLLSTLNQASAGVVSFEALRYFEERETADVFYTFGDTFNDIRLQQKVYDVMDQLSSVSCAEFVNLSVNDFDWNKTAFLHFVQGHPDRCEVAQNGLNMGPTVISLGSNCGTQMLTIWRAMLYGLGVQYEHLRDDRNKYVNINLSNVKGEAQHLFTQILDPDEYRTVTSYDISSVMHFEPQEHAILPHQFPVLSSMNYIMQPSVGSGIRQKHDLLSFRDKKTINTLLRCHARCGRKEEKCLHGGYTNENCRCICPYGFIGENCDKLLHHHRYNVGDECGVVSAPHGDILSPNYPQRYPKSSFCQWLIKGSKPSEIVVFKINLLDLEHENVLPSDRCLDKLFIWIDGTDIVTKHLSCMPDDIARYTNKWFSSQYNWLLIELRSDPWGQFEHSGFNITFKIVDTTPPPQETSEESSEREERFLLANYTKQLERDIGDRRLHCHECSNETHCSDEINVVESRTRCSVKEACAYKLNERDVYTWRGCAPIDECASARKMWYDSNVDYMDCCGDDYCNMYINNASTSPMISALIYFLILCCSVFIKLVL